MSNLKSTIESLATIKPISGGLYAVVLPKFFIPVAGKRGYQGYPSTELIVADTTPELALEKAVRAAVWSLEHEKNEVIPEYHEYA